MDRLWVAYHSTGRSLHPFLKSYPYPLLVTVLFPISITRHSAPCSKTDIVLLKWRKWRLDLGIWCLSMYFLIDHSLGQLCRRGTTVGLFVEMSLRLSLMPLPDSTKSTVHSNMRTRSMMRSHWLTADWMTSISRKTRNAGYSRSSKRTAGPPSLSKTRASTATL